MEPEKALLQEIASHQAIDTNLPPLKIEQTWLEELLQWFNLEDLIGAILRWLAAKTPSYVDFATIVQTLSYLAAIVIVTALVFVLLRRVKPLTLTRSDLLPQGQECEILIAEVSLKEQLKTFLTNKEYAKALRCRWKLFLEHNGYSSHLTPLGYTRNEERRQLNVDELYSLMFGAAGPSAEQFETTSKSLERNDPL
jgi:hypothetical protein